MLRSFQSRCMLFNFIFWRHSVVAGHSCCCDHDRRDRGQVNIKVWLPGPARASAARDDRTPSRPTDAGVSPKGGRVGRPRTGERRGWQGASNQVSAPKLTFSMYLRAVPRSHQGPLFVLLCQLTCLLPHNKWPASYVLSCGYHSSK
jgi:hypothetical protein